MNAEDIRELAEVLQKGRVSCEEAIERLKNLPYEDLGFAKIDHHHR